MPVIRIDSAMSKERELDFEARVRLFAEGLGGAIERTAGLSVAMGIENHGFQGNNLAFQLNVYKTVGSDRLGATMDTGNFYWRGYPLSEVYGILNILAPYAKHTHLKEHPVSGRPARSDARGRMGVRDLRLTARRRRYRPRQGDPVAGRSRGTSKTSASKMNRLGHYDSPEERIAVLERDVAQCQWGSSKASDSTGAKAAPPAWRPIAQVLAGIVLVVGGDARGGLDGARGSPEPRPEGEPGRRPGRGRPEWAVRAPV